MKYKDLKTLVNRESICNIFLKKNKNEILKYINDSQNGKGTVNVSSDFTEVFNPISRLELIDLLKLYINEYLLEWELEYILNSIDGCDFDDEKMEEVIYNLANPYLNFHINNENVNQAIKYLEKESLNLYLKSVGLKNKQKGKNIRPNYKSKLLNN